MPQAPAAAAPQQPAVIRPIAPPFATPYVLVTVVDAAEFSAGSLSGAVQAVFPQESATQPSWSQICERNGLFEFVGSGDFSPQFYSETTAIWTAIQRGPRNDTGFLFLGVRDARSSVIRVCRESLSHVTSVMDKYRGMKASPSITWTAEVYVGSTTLGIQTSGKNFLDLWKRQLTEESVLEKAVIAGLTGIAPALAAGFSVPNLLIALALFGATGVVTFLGLGAQGALRDRRSGWKITDGSDP